MTSIYEQIESSKDDNILSVLRKANLMPIFQGLFTVFPGKAEKIIRYIIYCYSVESPKVVFGGEWRRMKGDIYRELRLPDSDYEFVVDLKSEDIVGVIKMWLEYQDEEAFSTYCMLCDLIVENRIAANSSVRKASGEIDYDQKRKCAESAIDLLAKKTEFEQRLIQNHDKFKGVPEVQKIMNKKRNVTGPEAYSPTVRVPVVASVDEDAA